MSKNNFHKYYYIFAFLILSALFLYFRAKPIYFQTVPYTYDQGRDFLKAEEIIRFKNITFIGPTTGIQGVYHGVWWYYFLSLIYLIFSGWPSGFYYGVLFIHFLALVLFTLFLKKEFGIWISILFFNIVTVSPYFITTAFFPSNNTLTPLAVLLFIYAIYQYFKTTKIKYLYLIGLGLGLIAETALSFGIFYFPGVFLLIFIFSLLIKIKLKIQSPVLFFSGLATAFLPRILFELKNNFSQIRALGFFLIHPSATNPVTLRGAFNDRIKLFTKYFVSIFYENSSTLAIIILSVAILSVLFFYKKQTKYQRRVFLFLLFSILILFILSCLSTNNFFWDNYLEGIQYFFLFLIIMAIYPLTKKYKLKFVVVLLTILFFSFNIYRFGLEITKKSAILPVGLLADNNSVQYLLKKNDKNYCLRIYTPPVIPYTYQYLLGYYSRLKNYNYPVTEFVNSQCWYVIDFDSFLFRIEEWRKNNIPNNAKLIDKKIMENKTEIELWKI